MRKSSGIDPAIPRIRRKKAENMYKLTFQPSVMCYNTQVKLNIFITSTILKKSSFASSKHLSTSGEN